VPAGLLAELRVLANKRDVPYQSLMKVFLAERVVRELAMNARQTPDLIETGLRFVDRQRRTSDGRLDALLVDSGSAIVVAELKVVEDDGMLIQALDYYDYVTTNREALARELMPPPRWIQRSLRASSLWPRVFPFTLLNRVKWFNLPISLFACRCIQPNRPKPAAGDAQVVRRTVVEVPCDRRKTLPAP